LPRNLGRFPRLRRLTIHLKLDPRATLKTAFRPLTWWLPDLLDLEELELIDECKQKSTLPLRGEDWRALLFLLSLRNRRQRTESIPALRILILPHTWSTDHLPMDDGANTSWFDGLCKLTRLRINRASLRAILTGQPNGPVMPHLRILELTAAEGSGKEHPLDCECHTVLPKCPSLSMLRVALLPNEGTARWMRQHYPNIQRLCIDAPPRVRPFCCSSCICFFAHLRAQFTFTDADLAIARDDT
jgi:hypothetical protein